ncbi:MAG: hypothetical protein CL431_10160 [Acidimicrobiaceae bacterium]|nr:hypothetical protein [Acidimicrobiaceae bacterium]|tara:strand:- start:34556 stop:35986 length:1431 start_codon:yes stop_codon:yes gene_type:complete
MEMKTKLIAFAIFALFVSGCSSSDSAPEETTQVEKQSEIEPSQEDVKEAVEPNAAPNEDGNDDEVSEPAEEPKPQLANSLLEEKILTSLNQWIEENGAPGTAVSVLLPDGSQVNVAAGSRDRNGTPASIDDYWRIASISKPITSAIVLKLVEQEIIEIDEPVMTYLGTEWAQGYILDGVDYAPLITIRQILDHTDGFHEYAFDPGFYLLASSRLDVPFDPQEVVDWGFGRGPLFIPGTEYSYNTVGHVIAGLVIEAVTGKQAHELLHEYITIPANAPDMYLPPKEFPPEMVPSMFVQGELADLIVLLPGLAPYLDDARISDEIIDLSVGPQEVLSSVGWTGGGIESQMDDLARVFKAMFDGTILNQTSIDLFSEKAIGTSYALGIQLSDRVGYSTFEHGGGVPGFRSHARYFPDLDVAVALSANMIPVDPDVGAIADEISNVVIDHLKENGWDVPEPFSSDTDSPSVESTDTGEIG